MSTIKEDYVSFEIAKLLKEKGFDELCIFKYNYEGIRMKAGIAIDEWQNSELDDNEYSCPTLQMTMKWLREEHNISIEISSCCKIENCEPVDLGWVTRKIDLTKMIGSAFLIGRYDTYEMACEAAIKYCLERLI